MLIAPEAAAQETAQMLTRLADIIQERTGIQFRYSIADFPNMALTSEELIHKARQGLLAVPQALGLNEHAAFTVKDELNGASYPWRGARNFVMLDPGKTPAHVFSIHPA